MKIRTLIVDDEPLARERLRTLLSAEADIEVIGERGDGPGAVEAIRRDAPDLVFLDVQIPEIDGFGVIERIGIEHAPVVVFVTAYDQYAIRAFEISAIDYVLKPFRDTRFAAALAKAKADIRRQREGGLERRMEQLLEYMQTALGARAERPVAAPEAPAGEPTDRVVLKSGSDLHFVRTADIIWVE